MAPHLVENRPVSGGIIRDEPRGLAREAAQHRGRPDPAAPQRFVDERRRGAREITVVAALVRGQLIVDVRGVELPVDARAAAQRFQGATEVAARVVEALAVIGARTLHQPREAEQLGRAAAHRERVHAREQRARIPSGRVDQGLQVGVEAVAADAIGLLARVERHQAGSGWRRRRSARAGTR